MPRQQGCTVSWSFLCMLRDDISAGWSNHQSVTLDWDPRKVCFFPSREVRSTFQPLNNTLVLSYKYSVHFMGYSVMRSFAFSVKTLEHIYFSFLFPECSHTSHVKRNVSTLQSAISQNWYLGFFCNGFLPCVTAEHLCKMLFGSEGLSPNANI